MAKLFPQRMTSFELPATAGDEDTFTISKLKATSESLRCFNDVLARIGEAETEGEADQPPYRMSDSPCSAKSPS